MKTIALTQGKEAQVDDADYAYLSRWSWYTSNNGYAMRGLSRGVRVLMHRHILFGERPNNKSWVAHIDGDKLNNIRENLRSCKCRNYYLGQFNSKEEAASAYNVAATKFHGEFAILNTTQFGVIL